MSLATKLRTPGVLVKLYKNVGRANIAGSGTSALQADIPVSQRFSGQQAEIDLTPFLGEHDSINISKSVREPAGVFSIEFTDQVIENGDSLYGFVEPMDSIEVRIAGDAFNYKAGLPIMMRGFVSEVRRTEHIGNDGRPVRKVTVHGQDYGKIWQIYQIYYLPWAPAQGNLMTQFTFFLRFGVSMANMSAGQFVQQVVDKIINPFINGIRVNANSGIGSSFVSMLKTDIQEPGGLVSPFGGVGNWNGGNIYAMFQQFMDIGPWNEIFIEDRADGPYLVYRPNPFLTADKKTYILGTPKTPITTTALTRDDIMSIESARSDANVANFFWVNAPRYDLNYDWLSGALASNGPASSYYITGYGNVDPALYGFKKMEEQTNQGGLGESDGGNGSPVGFQRSANKGIFQNWIANRRAALVAQNQDNVVFEHGMMRVKGNENIKAGTYVSVTHGNMTSLYYVVSVNHTFHPFGNYVTTINFERGTGFIDRVKQGSGRSAPYWSELADSQSST